MTTRNLVVRLAVLGVATIALASCDRQVSTNDEQALADPTEDRKVRQRGLVTPLSTVHASTTKSTAI
jgi:hypothetical protein